MIGISRAAALSSHGPSLSERVEQLLALLEGRPAPPRGVPLPQFGAHVLCDLAEALSELDRGERRRAVRVRLGDEPCEIGLERVAGQVLLSIYGGGAAPAVHVFERRYGGQVLARRLRTELADRSTTAAARERSRVETAERSLGAVSFAQTGQSEDSVPMLVEPLEDLPFGLSAELSVRAPQAGQQGAGPSVLRADLLPLLSRGRLRVSASESARELNDVHVFLVAEQLARFAREALDAVGSGHPVWRKARVGGAVCGIRLLARPGEQAQLALTLGYASSTPRGESWTFPSLDVGLFARAVVDFGRGLAKSFVRVDRAQSHNLRLVEFRALLREVSEACREVDRSDSVINGSPESYRAYAQREGKETSAPMSGGRLRFSPKWTAAVPSIDLRSTFQCGDAFIVGSLRELCSIDKSSGRILWNRAVSKGVSVLTPSGVARFDAEGQLNVYDVSTGETRSSLRLVARVGAPVTGAVVSGAGLPRMLVISEGRRHLAGVDLEAGEVLWRYAARRAGTLRLKRAGRLVVVASGEQALTAIDVVRGDVVWRYCDRLRFGQVVTIADDSLFALAGALTGAGEARLCHLDPWSGAPRFTVSVGEPVRPIAPPLVARDTVLIATLGSHGTRILGFDKRTGERVFARDVCAGVASPLVVDDLLILNSEAGELTAIEAGGGEPRYRHVFAEGPDGDRPRRLSPVLRSGALFVPQTNVQVVRPADGVLLGTVVTDIIPDLLRVDERGDVYAAEESGHVAAFSAAARLMLVK